jgi:membrane protein implicated in regulation of membrane protease activity
MSTVLKFAPGLAAAIVALVMLKLIAWLGWVSTTGEIAVFLVTYLVVAVATDRAMQRYGIEKSAGG